MLKIIGGIHVNSRFKRDIREATPGCFFKFCIRMHSAIHLHCAREQCKFTCTVANSDAIHLHCSGDFFFNIMCIVFVYIFLKKLVLHCYVNNIFFPEKLV
jgi:hypothetical protein